MQRTDPLYLEIGKLVQQHDEYRKLILEYIADVQDEAVKMEKLSDKEKEPKKYEEDHKIVKSLEGVVRKYVEMERKCNGARRALADLQNMGHIEDLEGVFNRKVKEHTGDLSSANIENDERYLKFMKAVYLINRSKDFSIARNEEDEELEMTQATVDIHCPYTKEVMVHPVKCKKCNHVYEKVNVEQLLLKKRVIQCPVVGCKVKDMVLADLEPDLDMEVTIKQAQRNAKKNRQEKTSNAIELECDD